MNSPIGVTISKLFCPACRALTYHVSKPGSAHYCLACAGKVELGYPECRGCQYDEYCTSDPQKPDYCPAVGYHQEIGF